MVNWPKSFHHLHGKVFILGYFSNFLIFSSIVHFGLNIIFIGRTVCFGKFPTETSTIALDWLVNKDKDVAGDLINCVPFLFSAAAEGKGKSGEDFFQKVRVVASIGVPAATNRNAFWVES